MKKGHKLLTAFEAAPHLAAIASYGEDEQSLRAIRQRAQAAGYEIAADAAALVAVRCDFSALLAQSETEKLMTYAGQRGASRSKTWKRASPTSKPPGFRKSWMAR